MLFLLQLEHLKFKITDIKRYVPVVILSTQDNTKLLQQLKSRLKRANKWNKYQSKVTTEVLKSYLDYLINPNFKSSKSRNKRLQCYDR